MGLISPAGFIFAFLHMGQVFPKISNGTPPHHRLWGSALQTFVDDGCATAEELNGVSP